MAQMAVSADAAGLLRWLSGGRRSPREASSVVRLPAGSSRRPMQQAGLWPGRCLALFAFHDPPMPPTPTPPPLQLQGLQALLSAGAADGLCPWVMLAAVPTPILGGAEGRPVLVLLAKRIGAKVAK